MTTALATTTPTALATIETGLVLPLRYPVIMADLPWPFEVWNRDTGHGRSAESHYKTMSWPELATLGAYIDRVAAEDCALLLWACRPSQHQALALVLSAWNQAIHARYVAAGRKRGAPAHALWTYKTELFTWVKITKAGAPAMGMGYWSRANTEPVFLFTRGAPRRVSKGVPQVIEHPRLAHSAKPEEAQDRTEQLLPGPYLELFARRSRPGWTCLGNELTGRDIRIDLAELAAGTLNLAELIAR